MGNFLPKYPKNYFKNQKGLRSFWKMISIGISIIFGILACIDKFEKQWELNVFYFGIALLLFYIFIHPVWMDAKKKKGYKFEEDRIYVFNILGKQTRMIAYQTMEKAVQKRQVRCKNNGLVIGKGRNKICFLYEPGSLEAAKRVRQCYDMLQKHIEPALPCFRQTGQDLLDRRAFYRRCRKRQTILLLIGSFFAGVFCHNSSDPDATVMLIAAVVVGFCETLTLLSLYGTILLEAENEKKITREKEAVDGMVDRAFCERERADKNGQGTYGRTEPGAGAGRKKNTGIKADDPLCGGTPSCTVCILCADAACVDRSGTGGFHASNLSGWTVYLTPSWEGI